MTNTEYKGLSTAEVEERIADGKFNKLPDPQTKTVQQIVRDNVLTLFNILNIVLAVLVLAVGSYKNALFINIIIINILVGIYQEVRAKKTIDRLNLISLPRVNALRNGEETEIPLENIVLDDILILRAGNQIPSDCMVVDSEAEVDESLLTGESDAILKKQGDELLSGSFIIAGEILARVIRVGDDNYATKIAQEAQYIKKPQSEILRGIRIIIRIIGVCIVPLGLALYFRQVATIGYTVQNSIISTVAALIGMIPEGLVLLTTIALSLGIIRLSRHKTLVRELYSIETLAHVDVLCLDKTGTITEGTMALNDTVVVEEDADIDAIMSEIVAVIPDKNTTMEALRDHFGDETTAIPDTQQIIPFSSDRKWSGVTFADGRSYILGAPEFVLGDAYSSHRNFLDEKSAEGYRLLALTGSDEVLTEEPHLPHDARCLAFFLITDKIRENAKETLDYFKEQGLTLKVISGDNDVTVSSIAKKVGLENSDQSVDATTLHSDEELYEAAKNYTVFGRVTPHQKKKLVQALKKQGHTVAMTGDGVNDILALKEADCSIAMADGSDVVKEISQLILLNSDFSNMTRILAEGRRVINNITRTSSLYLVKTIYSFILTWLVIMAGAAYPFIPIQLTLISAVSIGIPSFFLALERNHDIVRGKFLTRVMLKALPGALTIVLNVFLLILIGRLVHFNHQQLSTIATILTGTAGLVILYRISSPLNTMRTILITAMTLGFFGGVLIFPIFFQLAPWFPLDLKLLVILIPMMVLIYPIQTAMVRFIEPFDGFLLRRKEKRSQI